MKSVEIDKLFSELCPTPSTPSTPIKEKKEKGKKRLEFQTIPPYMRSLLKSSNYVYEDLLTLDHETISGGDWGEINISDYITLEEKWKGKDLVHYICDMITNSKCSEAIIIGFVQTVVNVIHTQLMKTCSADDESSLEEFLQPLRDASLNRGFSYFGALMSLVAVFNGFTDGDEAFEVLFNRANWNQEDSPYVLNS